MEQFLKDEILIAWEGVQNNPSLDVIWNDPFDYTSWTTPILNYTQKEDDNGAV